MDNELLLFDRINVIKDIINKNDIDKFYISFSGGKDSTILHYLIDMAIPNNKIPRVFINTGIEYKYIYQYVKSLTDNDDRFTIIQPSQNIKNILDKYGYPFKSKEHSEKLYQFQNAKDGIQVYSTLKYMYGSEGFYNSRFKCPKKLLYQFSDKFELKVSDKCCMQLKKKPSKKWQKENNKSIPITGMRKAEGGQRINVGCIVTANDGKLLKFHPLAPVTDEWENWFIDKYNIHLCKLYYEPYNFKRTGCKGCPFALDLQEQLSIMDKYLPDERKQCEKIWKPVYDEYRRINYRLSDNEQMKLL